MCDALNARIHNARLSADTPLVSAARVQRIAVGDLIIPRRNDHTITFYEADRDLAAANSVRNGNRWRVEALDATHQRIAAHRLSDGARAPSWSLLAGSRQPNSRARDISEIRLIATLCAFVAWSQRSR
jgi:hypothetical protein